MFPEFLLLWFTNLCLSCALFHLQVPLPGEVSLQHGKALPEMSPRVLGAEERAVSVNQSILGHKDPMGWNFCAPWSSQDTLGKSCVLAPGWLLPSGTAETAAGFFSQFPSPQLRLLARDSHWCAHRSCCLGTVCSIPSVFIWRSMNQKCLSSLCCLLEQYWGRNQSACSEHRNWSPACKENLQKKPNNNNNTKKETRKPDVISWVLSGYGFEGFAGHFGDVKLHHL